MRRFHADTAHMGGAAETSEAFEKSFFKKMKKVLDKQLKVCYTNKVVF